MISGTTQGYEVGAVKNYGGFTDGDRAVSIAGQFGATVIRLLGFDFDEPSAKPGRNIEVKRKKLYWAKRLIFDYRPENVALWTPPDDK